MNELIAEAVITGNASDVDRLVRAALSAGTPANAILEQGLIAGMGVVGVRFRENEIFVPEVLVSARAMKTGLAVLEPVLAERRGAAAAKVLIGTVKGDIHDIGKNLVGIMLTGGGYEVIDVGTNVSPEAFVDAVSQHNPAVVGLSALLTTTMPQMRTTIERLRAAGHAVPVIVGGAPLNAAYAEQIGAAAFGKTATDAVDIVARLTS